MLLVSACSRDVNPSSARQTTILVAGPGAPARPEIAVTNFEVSRQTIERGQSVEVTLDFKSTHPARRVTLGWHGPDGWLTGYQLIDTTKTHLVVSVPAGRFSAAGRHRALLRSGMKDLAEDAVMVTD
jgi:hypothetical protein